MYLLLKVNVLAATWWSTEWMWYIFRLHISLLLISVGQVLFSKHAELPAMAVQRPHLLSAIERWRHTGLYCFLSIKKSWLWHKSVCHQTLPHRHYLALRPGCLFRTELYLRLHPFVENRVSVASTCFKSTLGSFDILENGLRMSVS